MPTSLFRNSLLALLLTPLAGLPAAAQGSAGRGVTAGEVAEIFQDLGYRAKIGVDGVGDPMITTGVSGLNVMVYFYDCKADRCGSLQLSAGLDLDKGTTLAVANAFNKRFRYGRVHLDDENDPYLEFDFEVLYADHKAQIASQMAIFESLLGDFTRETGFNSGGEPGAGATDAGPAPKPPGSKIDV